MYNNLNIAQMGYNLYDEYLDRYYENAVNFAKQKGLPMRYFHIRPDKSINYDPETKIQITSKQFMYDVYEFIPIIDMQMPTQQVLFDPQQQGTTYTVSFTCTVIGIKDPLPGDLLNFYDLTGNNYIDNSDVFRVKSVQYIRSMNNKVPVYRIDVENAPFKRTLLDNIITNQMLDHYIYFADTGKFFTEDKYQYFSYLKDNKNNLHQLFNNIYCQIDATFNTCNFDSSIKILQRNYNFPHPFPIAKIFKNYTISDLLIPFDNLYKILKKDPIKDKVVFKDKIIINSDDNPEEDVTIKEFNSLEVIEDSTKEDKDQKMEISYNDTICKTSCLALEVKKSGKSKQIINIFNLKKVDKDFILNISEFFNYYNNLYKFFYCYRELDDNFYNKTSINKNTLKEISNDKLFFETNELSKTIYEKLYNPGQYMSYSGGIVKFD